MAKKNLNSYKDAHKKFKLTKDVVKKFGLENYVTDRKFKNIQELLEAPTAMTIARVTRDFVFDDIYQMKSGNNYVLPLSIFMDGYKTKGDVQKCLKPSKLKFENICNRYMGQDLTNKSLLVMRMGGLGDLIVSQSVLKHIKDRWPSCKITYSTKPAFMELFSNFPSGIVDHVVPFPLDAKVMMAHDYHLTFIGAIENCEAAQKQNYYDVYRDVCKFTYDSKDYISKLIPNHILMKSMKLLIPNNTVLLHMTSTSNLRAYPDEKWAEICRILIERGYKVGIIDNIKRQPEVNNFIINTLNYIDIKNKGTHAVLNPNLSNKSFIENRENIFNLAAVSDTITKAIAIYSACVGGITIDSSFAHISGALRKPAVTICGPYPAYNVVGGYETVQGLNPDDTWNNECGFYPCYLNSKEHRCPFRVSNLLPGCTQHISPESVVDTFEAQLKKVDKTAN